LKMKYAILYDQNASISSYQEGRIGIPSTGLTPPQGVCLSQARIWIFIVIYRGVFCIQWVKVRSDCLFCWYWWNCWPSFHNTNVPYLHNLKVTNYLLVKTLVKGLHIYNTCTMRKVDFTLLAWVINRYLL
jgi:hypothetical protein